MMGNIQNRNSLIKIGINLGLTSYINPGYRGQLTIVINNISNFKIELVPGMRICQLIIHDVRPGAEINYSKRKEAKYLNEKDITLSKLHLDDEFKEYIKSKNIKNFKELDKSELMEFFEKRLKEKSSNFFKKLTSEEKKQIGLV